jgi:hypothetical protein
MLFFRKAASSSSLATTKGRTFGFGLGITMLLEQQQQTGLRRRPRSTSSSSSSEWSFWITSFGTQVSFFPNIRPENITNIPDLKMSEDSG